MGVTKNRYQPPSIKRILSHHMIHLMNRGTVARDTWARPPSVRRLFVEGASLGSLFGGLVGVADLFESGPLGVFLGIAFGMSFGLCFAVGGLAIGWMLVRSRAVRRKGLAIAFGVAITAIVTAAFIAAGGTVDPLFVVAACVVAVAVAIWRGHHYDRAVT